MKVNRCSTRPDPSTRTGIALQIHSSFSQLVTNDLPNSVILIAVHVKPTHGSFSDDLLSLKGEQDQMPPPVGHPDYARVYLIAFKQDVGGDWG